MILSRFTVGTSLHRSAVGEQICGQQPLRQRRWGAGDIIRRWEEMAKGKYLACCVYSLRDEEVGTRPCTPATHWVQRLVLILNLITEQNLFNKLSSLSSLAANGHMDQSVQLVTS